MLQNDLIQSYLELKIGLPPVLKAGSSGKYNFRRKTEDTEFLKLFLISFLKI